MSTKSCLFFFVSLVYIFLLLLGVLYTYFFLRACCCLLKHVSATGRRQLMRALCYLVGNLFVASFSVGLLLHCYLHILGLAVKTIAFASKGVEVNIVNWHLRTICSRRVSTCKWMCYIWMHKHLEVFEIKCEPLCFDINTF